MSRQRLSTDTLGERVSSLETENTSHTRELARHEEKLESHEKRLDAHDAVFHQVRGGIRTLVVLWTIAMALLGFRTVQDYFAHPVSAASAKP